MRLTFITVFIALFSINIYGQEDVVKELADSVTQKCLRERYAERVWQFGEFIGFIADTRNDRKFRLYHCKNALNLFQEKGETYVTSDGMFNQGVKIEILLANGQTRNIPLRLYLEGLANQKYKKVKIKSIAFPSIDLSSLKHVGGNKYEAKLIYYSSHIIRGYIYKEDVDVITPGQSNHEYILPLGDVVAEEIQK